MEERALRILSSHRVSVKEYEATSSWDRRRPRLPAPSLTKKVGLRHSRKWSWFFSARAGGDACGPRTSVT